jgi:ribonuclease Z
LILTHFSARYDDAEILVKEAQTIHGSVIAAKDLLEIDMK